MPRDCFETRRVPRDSTSHCKLSYEYDDERKQNCIRLTTYHYRQLLYAVMAMMGDTTGGSYEPNESPGSDILLIKGVDIES